MEPTFALEHFSFAEERLLPGLFKERSDVNRAYLMSLGTTALLQNFYTEAGVIIPGYQVIDNPADTTLHWGWEAPTCQLRGHFLGHWMSAAAMHVASTGDAELKAKLGVIVDELARCQKLNGGRWIGPIPEKYFRKLETGDYIWSPQYVMHKTIMGLCDTYRLTGNKTALGIVNALSEWYLDWTDRLAKENPAAMLRGEAGGMLEVWAQLLELTGLETYRVLAGRYAEQGMFDDLLAGKDPLSNSHANASIPLSHGAAKMYEVTGDGRWLKVTKAFWKCAVTQRDSFCTGGQNAGEFWIPPRLNAQFTGERNQEFCTVYNMVRLADYLFRFTGDAEYADYIELALYNGFLSQQNKDTGLPTYFLPMQSGSRKKWGTATRDFWCCHGTMVQAQAFYPELCWYADKKRNSVTVGQYIPSALDAELNGSRVRIRQAPDMKYYNDQAFFDESDKGQMSRWNISFSVTAEAPFMLRLRIPSWAGGRARISVNGKSVSRKARNSFVEISCAAGESTVSMFLEPELRAEALPGSRELYAVLEGPVVLAGLCGTERTVTLAKNPQKSLVQKREHSYGTFPWTQGRYETKDGRVQFVPLYDVTDETYTLYFPQA